MYAPSRFITIRAESMLAAPPAVWPVPGFRAPTESYADANSFLYQLDSGAPAAGAGMVRVFVKELNEASRKIHVE